MNCDTARRPSFPYRQEESWTERLLDILRRILVPGGRLQPVPVRVPVREPVIRRRV
jgi:hypothetical protein